MRRFQVFLLIATCTVVFIAAAQASASRDKPLYVGYKFCRACHSRGDNERYHLWLDSRHAKAFDVLRGAQKKDPACLGCHTTGFGKPAFKRTEEKDLRGVQCEACHGPGSRYKSMKIMKNPGLARKNGLWEVTREVCLRCHR